MDWVGSNKLCWMIRGGRDLMSLLKLRKVDLFGHGRFWIQVCSDTKFLNLNGNTIMIVFYYEFLMILQIEHSGSTRRTGLKETFLCK